VSCFGEGAEAADRAATLSATIESRASDESADDSSYTRRLLANENLRLKKLGEESAELIAACAQGDRDRAVDEAGDLFYHMLVALRGVGGDWADVLRALGKRAK
jgi:phosphoribosyl-ATP pyrophosphohydrolase/phosphoribosyl-AMP cyclohydrolase